MMVCIAKDGPFELVACFYGASYGHDTMIKYIGCKSENNDIFNISRVIMYKCWPHS